MTNCDSENAFSISEAFESVVIELEELLWTDAKQCFMHILQWGKTTDVTPMVQNPFKL